MERIFLTILITTFKLFGQVILHYAAIGKVVNRALILQVNNVIQDISKTAADRINGTYSELSKYYTSGM